MPSAVDSPAVVLGNRSVRVATVDGVRQAPAVLWRLPDSPVLPAVVIVVAAVLFVAVRVAAALHGSLSGLVLAGTTYVDPAQAPHGLHVFRGGGYDGQFYYRLALDPFNLSPTAHGIHFDAAYRIQRIGYPSIAWLVSAGQASLVPLALVLVNLAGLGVVAFCGGVFARDAGRHAAWGLLPAGYFGFLMTLGRDTTEVTAASFMMVGLLALRRRRSVLAALVFTAAVLTQETTLIVVAAVALVRIYRLLRGEQDEPAGRADLVWIVPGLAFVGWQLSVLGLTGHPPLHSDGQSNLGLPFDALFRAVLHYLFGGAGTKLSLLWLVEVGTLAIVVAAAAMVIRGETTAHAHERLAWLLFVVFAISVSSQVWLTPAPSFRSLYGLFVLSAVMLLSSRRRLTIPAGACAITWIVVAAWLAVSV